MTRFAAKLELRRLQEARRILSTAWDGVMLSLCTLRQLDRIPGMVNPLPKHEGRGAEELRHCATPGWVQFCQEIFVARRRVEARIAELVPLAKPLSVVRPRGREPINPLPRGDEAAEPNKEGQSID